MAIFFFPTLFHTLINAQADVSCRRDDYVRTCAYKTLPLESKYSGLFFAIKKVSVYIKLFYMAGNGLIIGRQSFLTAFI